MRARCLSIPPLLTTIAALTLAPAPQAEAQGFLKRFIPVKRVKADAEADYSLSQENGPWMVMACTFSGEGAERQARELVLEFRDRFNIPAYAHAMDFKLDEGNMGRGLDEFGAPVRMKYRKGDRLREWAVLAGDFPSIDDPEAQTLLQTVKTLRPDSLNPGTGGETSQSFAAIRAAQTVFVPRLGKSKELGPMRTAFMARNPLLPQEYFVPKGVDKFVEKMNSGMPYSLLDNKQKYSLKVATFDGQAVLEGASNTPRMTDADASPLEVAGDTAEMLVREMRRAGYDAYSFHDRHESIVTVGGFDQVTVRQLDGSQGPVPEIARLMQTFGAAFNTPSDPLQNAQLERQVRGEAQQRLQSFNQRFAASSQMTTGMKPKFARIPPDSKKAKVIPFDIYPQVVEVPKKSISAGFAWGR